MKNVFLFILFIVFGKGLACGPSYEPDYEYYNLFVQETINSPQYDPFLLAYGSPYYVPSNPQNIPNENIEDWQNHMGISYEDAYYLVFQSKREDVQALAKGNSVSDAKLSFANSAFVSKHKQALLYIAYAKFLEPYMYMARKTSSYAWENSPKRTVADLDYDKTKNVLTKSWNAESDKELKLRYGYQLVRLAHYNYKFQEAIHFFNHYVESLNYKPIMYYYALDQKGGAERGLGNFIQANADFFQFFTHTKNKKEIAYTSMKVTQDLDFQRMLQYAKTDNERNDIYLLLGYREFNNPIASMKRIIENSPDAIQAKVLMARAVNELERHFLSLNYMCPYDEKYCMDNLTDHRLPMNLDPSIQPFYKEVLSASLNQLQRVKDKDFWNLTTAFLYFLKKDYSKTRQYLSSVNGSNLLYNDQKQKLEMLVEITSQQVVDHDFENVLTQKYPQFFTDEDADDENLHDDWYYSQTSTKDFVVDILANRYFLQKEYGKSFLLQNHINALEYNPDETILNEIVQLYNKKNKNKLEQFLVSQIAPTYYVKGYNSSKPVPNFNFEQYAAQMYGTIALSKGKFAQAVSYFKTVNSTFSLLRADWNWQESDDGGYSYQTPRKFQNGQYNGYSNISNAIFGFNRIECFECDQEMVMQTDFLNEFPFIKPLMNKGELAEALVKLEKEGKKSGEKAAKANYLIGNFMFNTTTLGYFREVLTFDLNNLNGPKFHDLSFWDKYYNSDQKNVFYFKGYEYKPQFENSFSSALKFLDKAMSHAKTDELKAQILFTASKCEQGEFYDALDTDPKLKYILEQYFKKYDYDVFEAETIKVKTANYRTYFAQLKNYSNTKFFKEVKSNCKYFDYYSEHY